MKYCTNATAGRYLHHKIKNISPGPISEVNKIYIDQGLRKFIRHKIRAKRGIGKQVQFVPIAGGSLGGGRPRELLLFLLSCKLGNSITST